MILKTDSFKFLQEVTDKKHTLTLRMVMQETLEYFSKKEYDTKKDTIKTTTLEVRSKKKEWLFYFFCFFEYSINELTSFKTSIISDFE